MPCQWTMGPGEKRSLPSLLRLSLTLTLSLPPSLLPPSSLPPSCKHVLKANRGSSGPWNIVLNQQVILGS